MTSYGSITNSYNVNYMGMPNTTTQHTPFAIRTPPGLLYSTYHALGCGNPTTVRRAMGRVRSVHEGFDWTQYIDNPELDMSFVAENMGNNSKLCYYLAVPKKNKDKRMRHYLG